MSESVSQRTTPEAATSTGFLAAAELHSGDVVAGRFRIEGMLGIGGMGVVYRATDLSLGIEVAIKLLRPELARRPEAFERFRQELLLARQVSSPHVVRIHDIAQHGDRWLISMDYIAGESLEHRLDAGKIPIETALKIARALLVGLSAVHQRGVVHRDLKPANVLLDAEDVAYLSDFGIARAAGTTGVTQTGLVIGTPEYLSPEQARNDAVDGRSDLYAVGLILYEMLTGDLPFASGTPAETVMQRIARPAPSLARTRPDLPSWLAAFCARLLERDPRRRFADADAALRALDAKKVPRAPLDRRLVFGVAAALLAAIMLGAWIVRRPAGPAAAVAAVAPSVAVLPFESTDAALAPSALALETHLRAWLREAPELAVTDRRRTLDAIARTAPGASGEVLLRQLPELARAGNANHLVRGEVASDGAQLRVTLSLLDPAGTAVPQRFSAIGKPDELQRSYANAAGQLVATLSQAADVRAPPAPTFLDDAKSTATFGTALEAASKHDAAHAAELLSPLAKAHPDTALIWSALLAAQTEAKQDLPAETTRKDTLAHFAQAQGLAANELRYAALDGEGDDGALKQLEQLATQYPHDPDLPVAYAQALAANGEGKRAITVLDRHVAADAQDGRAFFLLGKYSIQQGNAQRAVEDYLVRALVLRTRAGDAAGEAETHNALGIGYERLGQLDAASEQYEKAVTMRDKLGDKRGLATSLRNLAVVQAVRGDNAAAERSIDRAKGLLEALGDRASLADLYNDRGVVAEEHGDFAAALAAYREALALRRQVDAPAPIAESLDNVGLTYYRLGEFDNALAYWQQALAAYEKLEDRPKKLRIGQSIGLLEIARGHFDLARKGLDEALRAAEDHQLPEEQAVTATYLAELALAEGRYADALAQAQHAGEIFARRADKRGVTEAQLLTARTQLALGNADASKAALAPLALDELGTEQHAIALLVQAQLATLEGDVAGANSKFAEARKLAEQAHAGVLALETRIAQARANTLRGDAAHAPIADLLAATATLGHVPLRLATAELALAQALQGARLGDAGARYREALPVLRQVGRWRDASALHALGALALTRSGATAEAEAARNAAAQARSTLLEAAPAGERALFEQYLDKTLSQESARAAGT
jgi:tetratricopeptide (TPR) repeat protein